MALEGKWDLAAWLRILVESSMVDSQFIGALTNVLVHAVDVTVDGTQKEKLQQSLTFLQKLQNLELEQRQHDEDDIKDLENMISAI